MKGHSACAQRCVALVPPVPYERGRAVLGEIVNGEPLGLQPPAEVSQQTEVPKYRQRCVALPRQLGPESLGVGWTGPRTRTEPGSNMPSSSTAECVKRPGCSLRWLRILPRLASSSLCAPAQGQGNAVRGVLPTEWHCVPGAVWCRAGRAAARRSRGRSSPSRRRSAHPFSYIEERRQRLAGRRGRGDHALRRGGLPGVPREGAPHSLGDADPAGGGKTEEEQLQVFRDVRDELRRRLCRRVPLSRAITSGFGPSRTRSRRQSGGPRGSARTRRLRSRGCSFGSGRSW